MAPAKEGDAVNFMFEERLFGLVELLHQATGMFTASGCESICNVLSCCHTIGICAPSGQR